nr:unnamed protein product [Callosobruchus analis]
MCIKFCGSFELAHDEILTSDNRAIFVSLVNFTAEIDALLAIHNMKLFKGISKTIQNELLEVHPVHPIF